MSVWTRTVLSRLTGLALGAALCAGCTASGDEKPTEHASSAAPSVSASAEPSPSPTPVPVYDGTASPVMPADMVSDGHLGARAAATYFVEVRHWALITNDPAGLIDICDPASVYCADSIETVRANSASGAVVEGGRASFTISSVLPPTADAPFFEILGIIDEDPMTKSGVGADEGFVTDGRAGVPFVIFAEFRVGDGWVIRGADVDTR